MQSAGPEREGYLHFSHEKEVAVDVADSTRSSSHDAHDICDSCTVKPSRSRSPRRLRYQPAGREAEAQLQPPRSNGDLRIYRMEDVAEMNETTTQVLEGVVSVATEQNTSDTAPSGTVSQAGKLALLAKAGKTDVLLLTLLAAEFGPQITTGLQHVPGCG